MGPPVGYGFWGSVCSLRLVLGFCMQPPVGFGVPYAASDGVLVEDPYAASCRVWGPCAASCRVWAPYAASVEVWVGRPYAAFFWCMSWGGPYTASCGILFFVCSLLWGMGWGSECSLLCGLFRIPYVNNCSP